MPALATAPGAVRSVAAMDITAPAGATEPTRQATLAFALALLAIPGVLFTWDLPAGGFWTGVPLAIAAVVVGLRARPEPRASAAIAIGALALLFVASWTAFG